MRGLFVLKTGFLDIRLFPAMRAWWAFSLLVAAWVCANSPQAACYAIGDWLMGAGTFSHQARLAEGVVEILGAERKGNVNTESVLTVGARSAGKRAAVPMPADAVIKKIELARNEGGELGAPNEAEVEFLAGGSWRRPAEVAREVPYPPPRGDELS